MGELLGFVLLIACIFVPIAIWRVGTVLIGGFNSHIMAMQSVDQRLARIEATLAAGQEAARGERR